MVAPRTAPAISQTTIGGSDVPTSFAFSLILEAQLTSDDLGIFRNSFIIGLSPGYSQKGSIIALGISDNKKCLVIQLSSSRGHGGDGKIRHEILQEFLNRQAGNFFALDMGPLAMSLLQAQLTITNAIDIQSAFPGPKGSRQDEYATIQSALGESDTSRVVINPSSIYHLFKQPLGYLEEDSNRAIMLAQRAWISQFLASYSNGSEMLDAVQPIDTTALKASHPGVIYVLEKLANEHRQAKDLQSGSTQHKFDVTSNPSQEGPGVDIRATQYKTKFRAGQNTKLLVENPDGTTYTEEATVDSVAGRLAAMKIQATHLDEKNVVEISSTGHNNSTHADRKRSASILSVLQGKIEEFQNNPWIFNIWLASEGLIWPPSWSPHGGKERFDIVEPPSGLNTSQRGAVKAMLSKKASTRLLILEGPPGTGKTSVIGSFVLSAVKAGQQGIWLIAQSNVAVKNIAEKLSNLNFFQWRLFISDDFYLDWHEHIYTKIPKSNCISSSDFPKISHQEYGNIPVFLCTLSMLSNSWIPRKFAKANPIQTLVVDEASQIDIGGYLPVFINMKGLEKCCFIGDDKQLPPFGQEQIEDLQSIFEVPHLEDAFFLDTQYRMPPQVGDVISQLIYDGELKSNPKHPISKKQTACFFYETPSMEERSGDSYKNTAETSAVLKIAKFLQNQNLEYKIITPYDGQRNFIELQMKQDDELDWGNKCFNVDSFQGNEEDYIIISLVRTRKLGFLANERRTNVMLTRFKKGMFIVSSMGFLGSKGIGRRSLVGELLAKLGPKVRHIQANDLDSGAFFDH